MAGNVVQLGYLGIEASDLVAWESFATSVLGAQVQDRSEDGSLHLRIDERHHRVAVHPGPADDACYLGWQVAGKEDLDLVAERLAGDGYEVTPGSADLARRRRVAELIQVHDPDGMLTEVFFGAFEPDDPFRPSRPLAGGFRTGRLGLGHVAFTAGDALRSVRFYRDLLGMELTDLTDASEMLEDGGWIYFLRCNPRHHSIVFGQANYRPRMHHWLMELDELDDVGRVMDLAAEHGVPIMQSLGKHNNDHMVSVYLRTPSGFEVEYGWNGRLIEDPAHVPAYRSHGELWGHKRAVEVAP